MQTETRAAVTDLHEAGRLPMPDGWRWVRLGDVAAIVMGQSPMGSSYNSKREGEPLLNGPTEFGAVHPIPAQWTTTPLRFAEAGDLLLCVRGATTGKRNRADQRYCIGRGLAAIRGNQGVVTTDFLSYALDLATAELLQQTAGSTFPNLPGEKLSGVVIPLPALAEQQRIVAILSEQLAAVERARAAAEAQLEAAKALPAAYLRAVFESDEARGWPRKPLGDLGNLLPSRSIATEGDVEVFAVTTACLTEVGFDPLGIKTARMRSNDASQCALSKGEILIARSNTSELVGRAAMYDGDPTGIIASDLTIRFMPDVQVYPPFIAGYLSALYLSGFWREHAGGTSPSMKKITRTQVVAIEIPVPSRDTQIRFTESLDEKLSATDRIRRALESRLQALNELPVSLLRRAFSGAL